MAILEKTKDVDLSEYLALCKQFRNINIDAVSQYSRIALKYYNGNAAARDTDVAAMDLENQWYASLKSGTPDYSVYDADNYLGDLWACWVIYSRAYIWQLAKFLQLSCQVNIRESIGNIDGIADLGCGCGYTTKAFKELFPNATVYGTNLPDTIQFAIATQRANDCRIVGNVNDINDNVQLIFASEYFEHIERPIEHLIDVLKYLTPRVLIIANAFGARSTGHFDTYQYKGANIPNIQIGRIFNKTLRSFGYVQLETKLWNKRPAYWIKAESKQGELFQ